MSDADLFKDQAATLVAQIYGLPGLPPSSIQHAFHAIENALYSAFCEGVAKNVEERSAIVEECAKALEGEIKSCTLGFDLADRVTEADAVKLLNAQKSVDVQIIRSLASEK
jgi:hypothetical protein